MNKIKYPISEIFFSVQGEGYHTGKPGLFIRFGKCNLRCAFCDTAFAWYHYKFITLEKLKRIVKKYRKKTDFLILTGGEPSLNELTPLIKFAKENRFYVSMETNGTIYRDYFKFLDWLTVSPKTIIDEKIIKMANELKIVITTPKDWEFAQKFFHHPLVYLVPVNNNIKIAKFIIKKLESLNKPNLRLGCQIHKVYKIK